MEKIETKELTKQYLGFMLGEEVFAISILKIREVLEFSKLTKVPRTPDFMKGVINLRGNVVPVLDLRLKLGMEEVERTVNTSIIILEINYDAEIIVMGVIVDSVKEVIDLNADQLEPPPRIGMNLNTDFIEAMGKYHQDFIIILKIEHVFSESELSLAQNVQESILTQNVQESLGLLANEKSNVKENIKEEALAQ